MKYKIYKHRTETDGRTFYVGCGINNRPYDTYKSNRSKEWLTVYENEGLIVEIVLETNDKEEALFLESSLIQKYKRIIDGGTLVNMATYKNGVKGKKHSNDTKKRMSKSHKGKKLSVEHKEKLSKPILQYNKDGTFIREWKSAKDAGETLNINRGNITQCCRGKHKTVGGFVWEYK